MKKLLASMLLCLALASPAFAQNTLMFDTLRFVSQGDIDTSKWFTLQDYLFSSIQIWTEADDTTANDTLHLRAEFMVGGEGNTAKYWYGFPVGVGVDTISIVADSAAINVVGNQQYGFVHGTMAEYTTTVGRSLYVYHTPIRIIGAVREDDSTHALGTDTLDVFIKVSGIQR